MSNRRGRVVAEQPQTGSARRRGRALPAEGPGASIGAAVIAALLGASACGCGAILGIEELSAEPVEQLGWSRRYGVTDQQAAWQLVLGAGGTLFATGSFRGNIDFGGATLPSSPSGSQRFLAALDASSGAHRWSKDYGEIGEGPLPPSRIAPSGAGIVVAGAFQGRISFGDRLLTSLATDIFLAKLGADGTPDWSAQYGGAGDQLAVDMATDKLGQIYLTGAFSEDPFDLGAGAASVGASDLFVAQLDGEGASPEPAWFQAFGDLDNETGLAVAAAAGKALVLAGSHDSDVAIGNFDLKGSGRFVAKLNANQQPIWLVHFGDARIAAIAVDGSGDVFITGDFTGTINPGTELTSRGGRDVFVTKLSGSGAHMWSRRFGDEAAQAAWALAVDDAGNLCVGGDFEGTINPGAGVLTSAGGLDAFVMELDTEGTHLWSRRFGGAGDQTVRSLAADGRGAYYLLGQFEQAIDLGHGELKSVSAEDLFIAKLVPGEP